ncbi:MULTISPECIES: efflux RND transporter periplasmic adaptor subunit [unclassified Clostridium]|uniref:efflux RND transporter periplasmic adaptor subunit n=1 Tax=unclassified Clostridium TaxID=2614128 RepID=UPI0002975040|nr:MULTISPECIES: efflux RND transporter periplasmic adaptor subunit [unclassified Clostridium]EKQ56572.1 MAG: RND family efflux transporter, MFP subunit [Clostridium sp. Maddingley MBC34-26]
MKKKKLFLGVTVVLTCIAGVSVYLMMQQGQTVETSVVKRGEINQFIEDTAVVQSNEKQTVYIEGSGKINSIKYSVGDAVKKNDVLLTMDKKDLELKLQDADSKIEAAKAQLSGADISNYLNKIEIAQADVDKAKADYDSASRKLQNSKTLYEAGAISKQDLDADSDTFKIAEATLKSSSSQLEEAKRGTPDYVKAGYEAGLEQAVIQKDELMNELEKQQVLSPIDGIVLEKLVDENSIGAPGAAAFLIGNVNSLELEADILSDDIYKVKIGNEVDISGKAIGDTILKGKIVKIAPEAKNITSSLGVNQKRVPVTIEISDNVDLLKPGYDLDIKIITETKSDTLIVPDSAVFDYQGNSCVFVVDNGKAVIRQIKKGIESEKAIEVIDGLREGERVLQKPDNSIKEGMKVKFVQN